MLYCDLLINGSYVWQGVLCEDLVILNQPPYQSPVGQLYFWDSQGSDDPDYIGLGSRFLLIYLVNPGDVSSAVQIPLSAVPNQSVNTLLGNDNATLNIYTRTATLTT